MCSVPGCLRPHGAQGLCRPHYHQLRRQGITPIRPPRLDVYAETAGRCLDEPGPCRKTHCRYHLAENRLGEVLAEPCVLRKIAARGPMTLQEIADAMALSRERVRQIEASALRKARYRAAALGLGELPLLLRARPGPKMAS